MSPAKYIETIWDEILEVGKPFGIVPASWNCLELTRVEAALQFFPFEMPEGDTTPWAGAVELIRRASTAGASFWNSRYGSSLAFSCRGGGDLSGEYLADRAGRAQDRHHQRVADRAAVAAVDFFVHQPLTTGASTRRIGGSHLWVEGTWELVMAAMGIPDAEADRGGPRGYFEKWLYVIVPTALFSGILGTGHHFYWYLGC